MTNFLDNPQTNAVKPPFKPRRKGTKHYNESPMTQEARDEELNNLDREEVTEDFGDSKFSDRV